MASKREERIEMFYKKIIARAELNPAECKFSEIPEHSFEEELNVTFKEDDDLQYNINEFVENVLKSDLKQCLMYRSTVQILENEEEYQYWHEKTKREIIKLKNFITKKQLKQYLYLCYHNYKKAIIRDFINVWLKSDLEELLIERESLRNNDSDAFVVNKQNILKEWKRLTDIIPLEFVVCFALQIKKNLHVNNISDMSSASTSN